MNRKKIIAIGALLSALLLILSTVLVIGVDTDWGNVEVTHLVIPTADGDEVNALMYKPATATPENPAPCVLLAHGGNDMMEQMTSYALELARRGYVCITRDAMANHDSDIATGTAETATVEGAGYRPQGLDTVFNTVKFFNFVDPDRIVAIGHSLGGTNTLALAIKHQQDIFLSINLGQNMYGQQDHREYNFNYFVIVGDSDESILRNGVPQNDTMASLQTAQLRRIFTADYETPDDQLPMIEVGKRYTVQGTDGEEYSRAAFRPNSTHAYYLCTNDAVQTVIYAITSECGVGLDEGVGSYEERNKIHTVWQWHDVGYFFIYVSIIAIMFVTAYALLTSNMFSGLLLKKPEAKVSFKRGSVMWWIAAAVLFLLPVVLYKEGILAANKGFLGIPVSGLWLCGGNNNSLVTWQWTVALAMLVLFIAFHFLWGKKHGGNLRTYGLATSDTKAFDGGYILKAAACGLLIVGSGYLAMMLSSAYTKQGIHIATFMVSTIHPRRTLAIFMYFLFQIPYFLISSLIYKSIGLTEFEDGWKGTVKSIGLGWVISLGALLLFWLYFVVVLSVTNKLSPFFMGDRMYIYTLLALPLVLGMSVANSLNLFITRKTNSIWTGLFAAIPFGTWMLISTGGLTKLFY